MKKSRSVMQNKADSRTNAQLGQAQLEEVALILCVACNDAGNDAPGLFVKALRSPQAFAIANEVLRNGEVSLSVSGRDQWYVALETTKNRFAVLQEVDVEKERKHANMETVETAFQAQLRGLLRGKDLEAWKKVFFFFFQLQLCERLSANGADFGLCIVLLAVFSGLLHS